MSDSVPTEDPVPLPSPAADDHRAVPGPTPPGAQEVPGVESLPDARTNPLLQSASALLCAAPRLRMTVHHGDLTGLRQSLIDAVGRFEADARGRGLADEQIERARYILCVLVDESVSGTPWGGNGAWARQTLLQHFSQDSNGGEKVFQLLQQLAAQPAQQRDLLELMYCALALGMEGRYRNSENGRAQLDRVRSSLAAKVRELTGTGAAELSPRWRGASSPERERAGRLPLWVAGAGMAAALALVFVTASLDLNARTDGTFAALRALDAHAVPSAATSAATPESTRLAALLQSDLGAGLFELRESRDRSVLTLAADRIFEAEGADLREQAKPLLTRIARALDRLPGPVLITGHTDNEPVRTLRFPSNWHLSRDRAASVKALLRGSMKAERLAAEGHADTEPLADNESPAGRARNRRIEITLMAGEARHE